ncbi:MAG: hypothetical protein WBG46_07995 [Nonlabens sp.]
MKLSKKNIYLLLIVTLVALIAYQFAIKNTFKYKSELEALDIQGQKLKEQELLDLSTRSKRLKIALQEKEISDKELRELMLEQTESSSEIRVLNFNEGIVKVQNAISYRYFEIQLEGSYNELLQLLNMCLVQNPSLDLIHYKFEYHKKIYRTKERLTLDIIFRKPIVKQLD